MELASQCEPHTVMVSTLQAAATAAAATAEHSTNRSTFAIVAGHVSSILLQIVSFATISIPLFFYRLLTWSFTLHLNFTSLLMILIIIATVTYLIVRYRFLTKYSRLKPIEPQKAASSFDLHPGSGEDAGFSKPGFKNYPDEFLSAFLSSIKIFGYLEQPVFHELARHLQTKKLLAGDTLFRNPEQEKSFYIVVDGHVQMLVKPDNEPDAALSSEEDDGSWIEDADNDKFRNYTLINEVGQGGTLSSLFTILSIFRESFNRSEEKERTMRQKTARLRQKQTVFSSPSSTSGVDMSREGSVDDVFPSLTEDVELRKRHRSSTGSAYTTRFSMPTYQQSQLMKAHTLELDEESLTDEPSLEESGEAAEMPREPPTDARKESSTSASFRSSTRFNPELMLPRREHQSVHPNIIARATVDTTLAVIPEEAFHKLTQKFPKAAAHIVQVIITRFHRVTLMTSHRYLGLTKELLRLERLMNESVMISGGLPIDFFAPGGMERLQRKFAIDDETSQGSPGSHPAQLNRSKGQEIIRTLDIIDQPASPFYYCGSPGSHFTNSFAESTLGNGHELATSPTRSSKRHRSVEQDEYSTEDDEHLRQSVVRCMSSALGIRADDMLSYGMSPRPQRRYQAEMEASRHNFPMDLFSRATATSDSQASPSLDMLAVPYEDDFDSGSIASSAHSGSDNPSGDSQKSSLISPEEIQILYFPQDAVLVRENEHNHGLFLVIDGLLDVSMTPTEGETLDHSPALHPGTELEQPTRKSGQRNNGLSGRFMLTPSSSTSSMSSQSHGRSAATPFSPSMTDKPGHTVASEAPAGRSTAREQGKSSSKNIKKPMFMIKPGGFAGYLSALTGYPSFVEIKAKTDTYVGFLSKKSLDRISDKNPNVMLKLAKQLVNRVSPLILHIDLSLEWMQVSAGQIICRESQPSESIYMVLHGRLRTIRERKEGDIEILGEFGHGDSVGELEVLTGTPTPSTLHAIRDSELARMPKTLFNALALRHPEITLQISRMVAFRSLQLVMKKNSPGEMEPKRVFNLQSANDASAAIASISALPNCYPELYGRNNMNLKTIGILPVNNSVPLTEFAESLKSSLLHSVGATCVLLNSATLTTVMGKHAFSRMGKLKMASWLAEQEEKVRIVLYLADSGVTSQWTRTCIRQADCILLVGLGDGDPSVGEHERFLINMKTTARKELVLLHGERSCASGTTQNWLKNRLWIQAHHHVYMPMRQHAAALAGDRVRPQWLSTQGRKMTTGSANMLTNVKDQLEKYYPTFGRLLEVKKKSSLGGVSTSTRNDFARLARRLCGKSVALVLGGGGARGVSHIGVIQALEEAGIPIDIIGGTSIGSFVGGLYAKNVDLVSTIARSKMFAGRVSSIWRQLMDLTYPVTAWFTGHEFNRAIWKCLGDSQIEDFWLPYFAVTTNITYSRMEVHTTGYAWRYIRASMSLSGYMPPICDNGHMLVDGGYMDNLPVSVAKNMGADIIIAVDVASEDDTSPVHYGDSISGWWALLHSFNPFRTYNVPSIADIQSRLAYVSSVAKLEEAKMIDGTLYVKLPVQQWGTLEFSKFHDIFQTGYDVGTKVVRRWRKAGYATGRLEGDEGGQKSKGKAVKGKRARRNSI